MKNSLIIILLIIYSSAFSQKSALENFPETVKKEKLKNAKLIGDIIPSYPGEEYNKTINYVSIEIITSSEGKLITAMSKNETLTDEQKNNLNKAEIDSEMDIIIKFNYKDPKNNNLGGNTKIKTMELLLKVVS